VKQSAGVNVQEVFPGFRPGVTYDSRCPIRDRNWESHKYKSEALPFELICSMWFAMSVLSNLDAVSSKQEVLRYGICHGYKLGEGSPYLLSFLTLIFVLQYRSVFFSKGPV
jgi:hypothetical protein